MLAAGPALPAQLTAFLAERLSGPAVAVVDAVRTGPAAAPRIFFSVGSLAAADALVRARCALKGSGYVLMEVLSPEEQREHRQLWPLFLAARAKGQRAQFSRARLVVDGVRVLPPRA